MWGGAFMSSTKLGFWQWLIMRKLLRGCSHASLEVIGFDGLKFGPQNGVVTHVSQNWVRSFCSSNTLYFSGAAKEMQLVLLLNPALQHVRIQFRGRRGTCNSLWSNFGASAALGARYGQIYFSELRSKMPVKMLSKFRTRARAIVCCAIPGASWYPGVTRKILQGSLWIERPFALYAFKSSYSCDIRVRQEPCYQVEGFDRYKSG